MSCRYRQNLGFIVEDLFCFGYGIQNFLIFEQKPPKIAYPRIEKPRDTGSIAGLDTDAAMAAGNPV